MERQEQQEPQEQQKKKTQENPNMHKRYFLTSREQKLPLFIDSIGLNGQQEDVERPEGFPCFHWLQTIQGEGVMSFGGARFKLGENMGVLLPPGEPHSYNRRSEVWQTLYITFDGPLCVSLIAALGLKSTSLYYWEQGNELDEFGIRVLDSIASDRDLLGLDASSDMYRFLAMLKKHGRTGTLPSLYQQVERTIPVLEYMEQHYGNPSLGLGDMAAILGISIRHLNSLFKQSMGITAYACLIMIRMRKAKELMTEFPGMPVRAIAERVGFRDSSHFVATFRRHEGVTPQQFRMLH
ncbi:Arabinose operon regulatory protein [compost metagenome]